MQDIHQTLIVLVLGAATTGAHAQRALFMGMGDLPGGNYNSAANGISADGTTATGWSNSYGGGFGIREEAFIWTAEAGMVGLGELPGGEFRSTARAISPDGLMVVGDSNSSFAVTEAFMWTADGGMVGMGGLPGGDNSSTAWGVSNGGRVVVGRSKSAASNRGEAFRWTPEGGMVGMGFISENNSPSSGARAVSADGSVIVGSSTSSEGGEAFRWTEATGMVGLGDLPGSIVSSIAVSISDNGRFIVGEGTADNGRREAFLWSEDDGMIGLGDLDGGGFASWARDVSDDGRYVVGTGTGPGTNAFLWERGVGIRHMEDVLLDYGIDIAALGWTYLNSATAISPDGRTITGFGRGPNGQEAWVAYIPTPATLVPFVGLGLLGMRRRR